MFESGQKTIKSRSAWKAADSGDGRWATKEAKEARYLGRASHPVPVLPAAELKPPLPHYCELAPPPAPHRRHVGHCLLQRSSPPASFEPLKNRQQKQPCGACPLTFRLPRSCRPSRPPAPRPCACPAASPGPDAPSGRSWWPLRGEKVSTGVPSPPRWRQAAAAASRR